jgi:hypothetical protein
MIKTNLIDLNDVSILRLKNLGLGLPPSNETGFGNIKLNRLAITLLCIFHTACTQQNGVLLHQNSVSHATKTEVNPSQKLVWPNKPGVTRLKDGQTAWQENDCDKKVLPFLVIKRQDFSNSVLQANQEFKHRFSYAVCTSDSSKPIKGKLIRKILFKDKIIYQSVSKDVEIKSGEWENVAFITIPPGAKYGYYNFRLSFRVQNIKITKDLPFVIRSLKVQAPANRESD